jgi:galactokinase
MDVPIAKSLGDIYPEDAVESQTKRWNALISKFKEDYGKLPDFVSRSPGRVNIIGEVCLTTEDSTAPHFEAQDLA